MKVWNKKCICMFERSWKAKKKKKLKMSVSKTFKHPGISYDLKFCIKIQFRLKGKAHQRLMSFLY